MLNYAIENFKLMFRANWKQSKLNWIQSFLLVGSLYKNFCISFRMTILVKYFIILEESEIQKFQLDKNKCTLKCYVYSRTFLHSSISSGCSVDISGSLEMFRRKWLFSSLTRACAKRKSSQSDCLHWWKFVHLTLFVISNRFKWKPSKSSKLIGYNTQMTSGHLAIVAWQIILAILWQGN